MKAVRHLLLGVTAILAASCLQDPETPYNMPESPTISVDDASVTRVSMLVKGTFGNDLADVTSYGIEVSENLFENGGDIRTYDQSGLTVDQDGYSLGVTGLKSNSTYYLRAFISNGHSKLYSSTITQKTPETSVASVSDVTDDGNFLVASIEDNGGRGIEDVGFVWSSSPDPKAIRRERRIPGTMGNDGKTFTLPRSALGAGTFYILAYAEDDKSGVGFSRIPCGLTVTDDDKVKIQDPEFERYLLYRHDTNRDGKISYSELRAIVSIDVETDNIYSVREIESMPDLSMLKVQGSAPGKGKLSELPTGKNAALTTLSCANNAIESLDLSGNPGIRSLDVSFNKLAQLDNLPCPDLKEFFCQGNALRSLDASGYAKLSQLNCLDNPLDKLYLSYYQQFELLKVPQGTEIVYVDKPDDPQPSGNFLTFTSKGTTRLTLNNLDSETGGPGTNAPVLYYSKDAVNWTLWDYSAITFTADAPLYIYGDNPSGLSDLDQFSAFSTTGSPFAVSGNIMSLLSKEGNITAIPSEGCFCLLFYGCVGLTSAPSLPSTALTDYCYTGMFLECSSLTAAPELPAVILKEGCYMGMFQGCRSMASAPELPAAVLADACYLSMFQYCSSLSYVKCLATDISAESCTENWMDEVSTSGTFVKAAAMTAWPRGVSGIPSGWSVQDDS